MAGRSFDHYGIWISANHLLRLDALFNGSFRSIAEHRIPPEHEHHTLVSFHQRPVQIRNAPSAIAQLNGQILAAAKNIRFRLISGYTNCNSGLVVKEKFHFAEIQNEIYSDFVRINIAVELLQPLLRNDLTGAER